MSQFYTCPSIPLEVTMIPVSEAEALTTDHARISSDKDFQTEESLNAIFNDIDGLRSKQSEIRDDGYTFFNHTMVFQSQVDTEQHNQVVTSKRFMVGPTRFQLLAEIYFEPYLLYELELSIHSIDVEKVRAHINNKPKSNDSLYKGAKRLFVELEPGEYELAIIYKNPVSRLNSTFSHLIPESVKYQITIVYDDLIDRQQTLPASLNYYGLLGPEGSKFG